MSPDVARLEYQPLLDGTQSFYDGEWAAAIQAAGPAPAVTVSSREASERYLRRHWITLDDLLASWLPLLNQVFQPIPAADRQLDGDPARFGPEAGFPAGWKAVAWDAGAPLCHESYSALSGLMAAAGDRFWALIERPHYGAWPNIDEVLNSRVPLHRLRFSTSAIWAEVNGDRADLKDPMQAATSVSGDLFTLGREEYFLFGDATRWGLIYRGGAMRGQAVLGIAPDLAPVASELFSHILRHHAAPEVLHSRES